MKNLQQAFKGRTLHLAVVLTYVSIQNYNVLHIMFQFSVVQKLKLLMCIFLKGGFGSFCKCNSARQKPSTEKCLLGMHVTVHSKLQRQNYVSELFHCCTPTLEPQFSKTLVHFCQLLVWKYSKLRSRQNVDKNIGLTQNEQIENIVLLYTFWPAQGCNFKNNV